MGKNEIEEIIKSNERGIIRSLCEIDDCKAYIKGCRESIKFWRGELKKCRKSGKEG